MARAGYLEGWRNLPAAGCPLVMIGSSRARAMASSSGLRQGIDGSGMVAALLLSMALTAAAADPPFSCGASSAEAAQGYAFCDATLGPAARAADLVSRLTPAEKVAQLGDVAPGVPRLGVPAYKWWNEALHGLATSGKGLHFNAPGGVRAVTSFPQVLLTAAAFDEGLWFRIGQVRTYVTTSISSVRRSSHVARDAVRGSMGTRTRTPALMGWVRDALHGAAPSVGSAGGTGGWLGAPAGPDPCVRP